MSIDDLWVRRNEALLNHDWILFLDLERQIRDYESAQKRMYYWDFDWFKA
jgi:hypothetical protein